MTHPVPGGRRAETITADPVPSGSQDHPDAPRPAPAIRGAAT
ncbi:hypothetical protein [Microlunatus parietis]|uniref:Uncharacterized protein n=1 Tax=Microlunatus parietis TaxID=682979 RepID=A0A7Y9IAE5_9ACTN|nr:hypothetical protein [Microlunatus parietis]NYE73263.1 hypothetical protein [Microlunatus parietis]